MKKTAAAWISALALAGAMLIPIEGPAEGAFDAATSLKLTHTKRR